MKYLAILGLATCSWACSGAATSSAFSGPNPAHPQTNTAQANTAPTHTESLPRLFTVELLANGEVLVFGTPLARSPQLLESAKSARALNDSSGAALLIEPDVADTQTAQAVSALMAAGWTRIHISVRSRTQNATTAVVMPAPSPAPTLEAPAQTASPSVASASGGTAFTLRTFGLHIGGGPNDEGTKSFFRKPIESEFPKFRACAEEIPEAKSRAGSFGVDLYIPASGGHPKVKGTRTRVGDNAFVKCVSGAFEQVDFLKPSRGAAMISYSLKFTPAE